MRFENKVSIQDGGRFGLGVIKLAVKQYFWDLPNRNTSLVNFGETEIQLTAKGAREIIERLTIALELLDKEFIIHDSDSITIDDENGERITYANYADYLDGKPETE